MSWAASHVPTRLLAGEVLLIENVDFPGHLADAERAGLLPALPVPPGPAARGQLALVIEAGIESALERRGACPPGIRAGSSLDAALSDQLYRARLLEFSGIALALPSLSGIADLAGTLDAEDSAVLRWWIGAADHTSLRLLIDKKNGGLGVYGPPRPLADLLSFAAKAAERRERAPHLSAAVAESAAAMELSEPPPPVAARAELDVSDLPTREESSVEASEPPPAVVEQDGALAFQQPLPVDEETVPYSIGVTTAHAGNGAERIGDIAEAVLRSLEDAATTPPPDAPAPAPATATFAAAPEEAPRAPASTDDACRTPEVAEHEPIAVPPLFPKAGEHWRTWLHELEGARGAKPLAAIERMFVANYVPLRHAVAQRIAEPEAARVLDRWSTSFAQSYREAFEALRVRGKRPTMVLDVPELALRIGRLHGARSVQLVLVDGLRFDLGLRVEQRVRALLGQQAALTERLLLWSALPSTTEVQLDLIGRGPDGLRSGQPLPDLEAPVARGRAASTLRRVKAGHRELLKLDLVEAGLADPGASEPERLDALADETARVLADYIGKQVPRTLVFAFGDHGFVLDPLDTGTTRASNGGATPEEVLVPGFAWLVGGVH